MPFILEDSVPKGSKSATTATDPLTSLPTFDCFEWDDALTSLLTFGCFGWDVDRDEVAVRKLMDLVALIRDTAGFFSCRIHELEIDPVNVATNKAIIEGGYSTLSYKFGVDRVNLETLGGHAGGYYSSFFDTPEFDPVKFAIDRLARIRETSSGNIASFYPHSSHGLGCYLDEGNTNYGFVIDLHEVTAYNSARSKEISLGNTAGYYHTPSYGLEAGLVVPAGTVIVNYSGDHSSIPSHQPDAGLVESARKFIFNYSGDHYSIPSHKLDAGLVKYIIDAFASIQETSYELDVGLVKPITNAFAWIKGGIDTFGKIVSPFHWAYEEESAIVGGKAVDSENSALLFVDPNDTVLSQLLAVINIGEDLVNKGIDNWIGVKTSPHEELTLVYPEVQA